MIASLQKFRATLREQGWWLLIAFIVICAALWGFAEIADEVVEGESHRFDRAVLLSMRVEGNPGVPIGPPELAYVERDLTALGGATTLVMITLAAIGYLLMRRRFGAAGFVFASVLGGTLLSSALKVLFERSRPDVVPHLMEATSASFPSGHSMLAMVVYLTLGAGVYLATSLIDYRFWLSVTHWIYVACLIPLFLVFIPGIGGGAGDKWGASRWISLGPLGTYQPSETAKIGVLPSIEMVVWVAAGGRGTLVGAITGAIGVNWIQSWLTTSYPDLWLLFLGALFMGVVLFFPDGVVGAVQRLASVGRRLRPSAAAATSTGHPRGEPASPTPLQQ